MRGYDNDRDELQDYDDYYEEGEGQDYEEEGEEEYEGEEAEEQEEEPRKPTKQELEYLELRQKLKESIRKKMKKESSGSGSSTSRVDSMDHRKRNKLPYDNYGSFFGPSQPVIAQRVIEESKSFLENPRLASKISNPHQIRKNQNKGSDGGSKSISHDPPKVSEGKVKAQKLKDTRDYSFLLSDDVELPAPSKAPSTQNLSVRSTEGRSAHQAPGRSRQPSSNGGKLVPGRHEERKPGSAASHLPPKSGPNHKLSSTSKSSMASADSRKQLANNSRSGPGRPVGPKAPPKVSTGTTGNKSSTPGIRKPVNSAQKPLPSKVHASVPRQSVEQRKDIREPNKPKAIPNKPKVIPKQPVASSKPQINKPVKQNSVNTALQDHRPKNKVVRRPFDDVEDEMDVSRMIRSMFNYNPNKFADDDDDDNMEAGFDEILREERRSAIIAKREDDEQLRLIEEEEERERKRRMAKSKKRKLGV